MHDMYADCRSKNDVTSLAHVVLPDRKKDVDGRNKSGHDASGRGWM